MKTQNHFSIQKIRPLTENQSRTFEEYHKGKNLMLHGSPGTGKTFISLYLSLDEILNSKSNYYKISILRSIVPSRDIGFLPGKIDDKARVYEEPYDGICADIFGRGDAYGILKQKGMVEFSTTSFLRGCTFVNSIVIVDECQNMTAEELYTVVTRVGENTKIIFCGDFRQSDLHHKKEKSGILDFMEIIKTLNEFSFVEFDYNDIVRSQLVKNFIIAEDKYRRRQLAA